MTIVEFDGPSSWSLDASETGKSTKCLWVGAVESTAPLRLDAINPTASTHGHFVLSPVPLASRDQETRLTRSTSMISRKNRGL